MGTEAHVIRFNARDIRVSPGALWLHTCRRAAPAPRWWSATPRRGRTKNLIGRLRAEHVECERHSWAVRRERKAFDRKVENAAAVRMVCVGPRGS